MINWQQTWSDVTATTYIKKYTDWKPANTIYAVINDDYDGITTSYDVPKDSGNFTTLKNWENLNKLTAITYNSDNYAHYFNINLYNSTLREDTPMVTFNNFGFDIPTGLTISGILVKISKSYDKYHDLENTITNTGWTSDQFWYDNLITSYTRDTIVTLDYTGDTSYDRYTNNASLYTTEQIDTQLLENGIWKVSETTPQYYYTDPINTWSSAIKTYIYGAEDDLWGNAWTPEIINSSGFSIKIIANQHIFRSYETIPTFRNNTHQDTWENSKYYSTSGYTSGNTFGFMTSKLHNVLARVIYLEPQNSYYVVDRDNIPAIENMIKTEDIYFNYEKCLNGVCYKYINDVNDIYTFSLLTGDNRNINNTYNEYGLIDKYLSNFYQVDIATNIHTDLNISHYTIDNVKLKPTHKILLLNQSSATANDIYIVDDNYKLILSDLLSTTDKSFRAIFYVKNGTYKEKQFHLLNVGDSFPITGEHKHFIEKHAYILKNKINYNIINTNTENIYDSSGNTLGNPCKLIFTNYEIARTLYDVRSMYYDINILPTGVTDGLYNEIKFTYLNTEYSITDRYNAVYYYFTGSTSAQTMLNYSGHTEFFLDTDFSGKTNIGDYLIISILTGTSYTNSDDIIINSYINYMTTVKSINSSLIITGEIPTYVINDLEDTGYTIRIWNLNNTNSGITNFARTINESIYNTVLYSVDLINNLNFYAKTEDNNAYFDYSLLDIVHNIYSGVTLLTSTTYNFTSNNQYVDYTLYNFLSRLSSNLPINIYNENYLLSDQYVVEEITMNYTGHTVNDTYYEIQSSMFKITPTDDYLFKLENFKPFTFIDYGILITGSTTTLNEFGETITTTSVNSPYAFTGTTGRTMIYEVTDTYMIIEKPVNYTDFKTNIYDIINVSRLTEISNILYDVYTNYTHDYYYKRPDNMKNCISGSYAQIIRDNNAIRDISTGIVYCDEYRKFNFDLFHLDMDENFIHSDRNLTYEPIELIDIGIDRITKLPVLIEVSDLTIDTGYTPLFYTGNTELSYGMGFQPYISVINTTLYNNNIYVNLNYQGVIYFSGSSTDYSVSEYNQGLYFRNNAVLVISTGTTLLTGLTEDKIMNINLIGYDSNGSTYNHTANDIILNSNKLNIDNSGNTYLSGSFKVDNYYYYPDSFLLMNKDLDSLISKSKQNGFLITYDSNFELISGYTYSDEMATMNYVRSVLTTDDSIFVTYQYRDI